MKKLALFSRQEDGVALVTVVMMITVLTLLGVVLIDQVRSESRRSASAVISDGVYQAAEAGVNDYIAKLLDDPQYYDHFVANGESSRQPSTGGSVVAPGGEWTAGVGWTYPSGEGEHGKTTWYQGSGENTRIDGHAYNLLIEPPVAASGTDPGREYLTVVSTGCKLLSGASTCDPAVSKRAIEIHLKRTTPADFAFMYQRTPTQWGQSATTYGRIYVSGETYTSGGGSTITDPGDICHDGTAYGDLMAEGRVNRPGCYGASNMPPTNGSNATVTYMNGATKYDSTTNPKASCPSGSDPPCPLKSKVEFDTFSTSLTDIKRAAELNSPSTSFDDTTASAWRINFSSSGTVQVWKCKSASGDDTAERYPFCGPDATLVSPTTIPRNGVSFTLTVGGNPEGFSTTGGTIYLGPSSGGRTETITYSSRSGSTFSGANCTSCGSSSRTHAAGERVTGVSGGITWPTPMYDGPIPAKGGIYTGQDAIVGWPSAISGYSPDGNSVVDGKVTVASGDDVVVGGNIHYHSELAYGGGANDDVLGLIAKNNVWVAQYTPNTLFWRAAVIAQEGMWSVYDCTNHPSTGPYRGSTSRMTFVGSMADAIGEGCACYGCSDGVPNGGFAYRDYASDDGSYSEEYDALKFLFPPWYPVLDTQATVLFREVPPSYAPLSVVPSP